MTRRNRLHHQNPSSFLEHFYPWAIITLCAIFLFYKYVMQISPSVMTNQLMQTFHVHGTGLGNLAATFFYAYMITQLFVGMLLDRYSPRYLCSAALLVSAIGTYCFAHSHTLFYAEISRAMMGVGAAFATVCYMKMAANWFKPEKFAFISGLLTTAVMLGAIFAEAPLAWLIHEINWRNSLTLSACVGAITACLFYLVVRDHPDEPSGQPTKKDHISWRDILNILTKRENWLLTFYSGLAFSPLAVFGGLWGNPFLHQLYHTSITQSASLISLAFLGLAAGGPILGYLSDRLNDRRTIILWGLVLSCCTITLVIYTLLPIWLLGLFLFLFGFGTGAFMLAFAIGKESNPIALAATVIAMINTGDALFGATTEPLVGQFLDLQWNHQTLHGAPLFSTSSYQWAFLILPLYLVIAFILALFFERKPRQLVEHAVTHKD